jgi:hypothetical protein
MDQHYHLMVDRPISSTLCLVLSEHLTNHDAGTRAAGAAAASGCRLIVCPHL